MRTALLAILVSMLLWSCAGAPPACEGAACEARPAPTSAPSAKALDRAPEITGGTAWLNTSEPLTLEALRGHVVILDFWTYCCINCLHVLPELERVERQFAGEPVHVIGVHSGKFDAEKDAARIRTAMDRHGVRHPVVVDSDFAIWKRFGVRAWPTLVLIGPEGEIIAKVPGEPKPGALAKVVRKVLDKAKKAGTLAATRKVIDAPPRPATGNLAYPGKVAVGPGGRIAVADSSHHRVVILNDAGEVLDVAGSGIAGSADGGFDDAAFRYPQGLAFGDDVVYVADTENHQLRALDLKTRRVRTLGGTGQKGGRSEGGPGLEIALRSPWALARSGDTLFVAMAGGHQIWTHDLATGHAAPLAGTGGENIDDGDFAAATFSQPSGLALVGRTLFVADSEVSAVRALDLETKQVRTLVGTGLFDFGDEDGVGKKAKLQHALGIADRGGVLFLADTFNNKLKQLDPLSGAVTTLAGGGGELAEPGGLAVLADGRVLIADTNHHRLQTFDPISGALAPFVITGLTPPATRGLVLAEGATAGGSSPLLRVKASGAVGKTGTLLIEPRAPSGAKLTDDSPMVAEIDRAASRGVTFAETRVRTKVAKGAASLRLPLTTDGSAEARAVVDVSFFWCTTGDEQACYPAHARLDIALDASSGSGGTARVVFQATR